MPPEQNQRHHQRRQRSKGERGQLAHRHGCLDREVATPGDHGIHHHQHGAHHQPRHHATQEQVADGGVRNERIQNQRDRRRDDRTDGRGCSSDRSGIGRRVPAVLGHHLDDQPAQAHRIRDGRPRHAGKDDGRDHVDVTEPAAKAPDQGIAEAEQAVAQRAHVHDLGGQDEQRDRQQRVAVVQALQQLFCGNAEVLAGHHQVEDRGAQHRQADRQAEQAEDDDDDDGQGKRRGHVQRSSTTWGVGWSSTRRPSIASTTMRAWRAITASTKAM